MEERPISFVLTAMMVVMMIFLLASVLIIIPISFSADSYMTFPPSGWSLKWYRAIFADPALVHSFRTSLLLAVVVTVLSLLIGLPATYALVRLKPWGADALGSAFTAPLLLPAIILGLALLVVFAGLGLLGTYWGFLGAHLIVTLPYAVRVLSTAMASLPIVAEEAAATLGASPWQVFWQVTLPMMRGGVMATASLCFLVSFDEVVLSLFMAGPHLSTLPVELYHHIENEADPLVAAVSVLLILLTMIVVLSVERAVGLGKAFVK